MKLENQRPEERSLKVSAVSTVSEVCPICNKKSLKIGQIKGEMVGYCDNCGFCPDGHDIMALSYIEDTGSGLIAINDLGREFLKRVENEKKKLRFKEFLFEQKEG